MCVHILKYVLEEHIGKDQDICCRRMLLMSHMVSSSHLSSCKISLQWELMIQKKWEICWTPLLTFTVCFGFFLFLNQRLFETCWNHSMRVLFGWKALIYSPPFKMACSWNTGKLRLKKKKVFIFLNWQKIAANPLKFWKCHLLFRWKLCMCIQWTISQSWLYQECQPKLVCEHTDWVHSNLDIFDIHKEWSEGE